MIREEKISVFVETEEIYPDNISIILGIGKGYNTCTCSGKNLQGEAGDVLKVIVNEDSYFFYITEKNYSEYGAITFTCKGFPYKLENQSESDETLLYNDSNELINGERDGINVINNIPNIIFGNQAYNKTANPMQRIKDMVNVVGGEMYEIDSQLILNPITSIPASPNIAHTFSDNEIVAYSYANDTEKKSYTKEVILNPLTDDIYSEAKISLEFSGETGRGNVFFNPSLSQGHSFYRSGATMLQKTFYKEEEILLQEEAYISTIGGIDTIVSIQLDGESISNYTIFTGYNIIKFEEKISGTLNIKYSTNGATFTIKKPTTVEIKYDCAKLKQTISLSKSNIYNKINDNTNDTGNPYKDGWFKIETPVTTTDNLVVKKSEIGNLSLVFSDGKAPQDISTIWTRDNTEVKLKKLRGDNDYDTSWITIDNGCIESNDYTHDVQQDVITYDKEKDKYLVYLNKKPEEVIECKINNESVSFNPTIGNDEGYITFEKKYNGKSVSISLKLKAIIFTFSPPPSTVDISTVEGFMKSNHQVEEYLQAVDNMCSLPAKIHINIAEQLETTLDKVIGKQVSVDTGIGNLTVDNFGEIQFLVTQQAMYTVTCESILHNAKIFVDATGVDG